MRPLAKILIAALVFAPCLAFAGDAPIFVVQGWGIGSMDGRLMFYLGDGDYLATPLRLELRWLVLYALVAAGIVFITYGRRDKNTSA